MPPLAPGAAGGVTGTLAGSAAGLLESSDEHPPSTNGAAKALVNKRIRNAFFIIYSVGAEAPRGSHMYFVLSVTFVASQLT